MLRKNLQKVLYEVFIENPNLSKSEIVKIVAEKAKVTVSRVWVELERPELRNKTVDEMIEALSPKRNLEKSLPKEVLEEMYIKKEMSIKEISELYPLNTRAIKKLLLKYGIPLKGHSELISKIRLKGKTLPTADELMNLYVYQGKSLSDIARTYGFSLPFICKLTKKYKIDKISKEQFLRIKLSKIKSDVLESIDKDYKALKGLVGLIGLANEDEDAFTTAKKITSRYVDKLGGIYRTFSENHTSILEELYLIYKNNQNKLESLLLHCLYNASIKTNLSPLDVREDDNNFLILQKVFFSEIRKLYIEYKIKNLNK